MKKKNYKKTIISSLILGVVFALTLALPTFAYTEEDSSGIDNTITESEENYENSSADTTEENIFDTLYLAFSENISEILSVFTFIGSLTLMLGYKKGFLPIFSEALKALSNGVKSIGEKTENLTSDTEKLTKNIQDKINYTEDVLAKMSITLSEIEQRVKNTEQTESDREKFVSIISAQIDMLYEIFMSAALPQYLKDNVGERIAIMKSELKKETRNECEN